jgi:hypothetical protein
MATSAVLSALLLAGVGCGSDESSTEMLAPPTVADPVGTLADGPTPTVDQGGANTAPIETTAPGEATPATPAAGVDTTYFDLYRDQGLLYDPFFSDALGADIQYVEATCNEALFDLAEFGRKGGVSVGSAAYDVDAATVFASLSAATGGLPSQVGPALDAWQRFIDDYAEVYRGPFLPVSQGNYATLETVLVDPGVVAMLDAFTSLELVPPNDYVQFLDAACTSAWDVEG